MSPATISPQIMVAHPRRSAALFAAVLAVVTAAGCRMFESKLSAREQVVFDSLSAAVEAQYTLASPNLGYDRYGCVAMRADAVFGFERVGEIGRRAEREVQSRQHNLDLIRRDSMLVGDHPVATAENCVRVDSLWYASPRWRDARP